ncbi:MAG: sulfatase-like hydrolase/transferase [Planctomycetota bacterium]
MHRSGLFSRFVSLTLAACLAAVGVHTAAAAEPQQRPNIILFMLDDASPGEFSPYGTPEHPAAFETPHVDALAERGTTFVTTWATPLCAPTRALLLTGKYANQTGEFSNSLKLPNNATLFVRNPSIAQTLADSGYRTALAGKWMLPGLPDDPGAGFHEHLGYAGYFGKTYFNEWTGPWFGWKDPSQLFPSRDAVTTGGYISPSIYWHPALVKDGELQPSDENTFGPDVVHQYALDFIKRDHGDQPFFLYYAEFLPHRPWVGVPTEPGSGERTEPGIGPQIHHIDAYVRNMMQALEEAGIADNTIFIFTSDNPTQGYGKHVASELGARVPMIVTGPGVQAGHVTHALTDFSDLYPTLMELAGLDPAAVEGLDGKSFLPVLTGESDGQRDWIYSYIEAWHMVRDRDWLLSGDGSVWRTDPSGDMLDYQKIDPPTPESEAAKARLQQHIAHLPPPTEEAFGDRLTKAREKVWILRAGDHMLNMKQGWKDHPERTQP